MSGDKQPWLWEYLAAGGKIRDMRFLREESLEIGDFSNEQAWVKELSGTGGVCAGSLRLNVGPGPGFSILHSPRGLVQLDAHGSWMVLRVFPGTPTLEQVAEAIDLALRQILSGVVHEIDDLESRQGVLRARRNLLEYLTGRSR